jgi:hypothetical protein
MSAASAIALSSTFRDVMAAQSKPNMVVLLSDDHSLQTIGAYKSRLQGFINRRR